MSKLTPPDSSLVVLDLLAFDLVGDVRTFEDGGPMSGTENLKANLFQSSSRCKEVVDFSAMYLHLSTFFQTNFLQDISTSFAFGTHTFHIVKIFPYHCFFCVGVGVLWLLVWLWVWLLVFVDVGVGVGVGLVGLGKFEVKFMNAENSMEPKSGPNPKIKKIV